ncbi:hypothetical protein Scep_024935 [Stephania cephalantha]|uniref:Glycosyltransferase n=1 Tax=Stephania cephalantha TaxID=152367 RepID=A0AAP0HYW9_9MAGN
MPKNKETFLSEFKRAGSQALANLIQTFEHESCPATCLIYTPLLTWVVEVARKLGVSFAMLWIQPAALFAICHYYFNGYKDQILGVINNEEDQSSFVELPGLPKLTCRDLPSFLFPTNAHLYSITMFEELFECLKLETMITKLPPRLFVNTIEEMEITTLKMLQGMVDAIAVGPLISPSIFLGMVQSSHNCLEWLNSKDNASVVYVAFGSLHAPKRRQVEEIARGLVATGRPFVWVLRRAQQKAGATTSQGDEECVSSLIDEINKGEQGLVVDWCSQIEVLSHSSIGCFVSHCGWNSTFESLVAGVPIAGFPLWADQWTNAKLIEDVWEIGVRVQRAEDELVESEEIKRCVEMVMGEGKRGQEIRRNAKKWRDLARKTVEGNGGSVDTNLFEFLEEIAKDH